MSKRDQFEVIKPRNLPKIGAAKHRVGGSKLKLMGQPPHEVYIHNGNQFASVPSLTRLHWRRSMKRWSMCWRKLVMISISGLFVLTWRWWTFCWDNSLASPSTHVFCACGIVGTVLSITRRRTGLCGCLAKKGTSSTTLWWTETEYSSHRCTSSSA